MIMTPRRSALFMPAHNERAIAKARTLDCDVVILDLEDAVAPDTKQSARDTAKAVVVDGGFDPREIAVRVNGIGTEWHTDDINTFVDAPLDAIVIPKAELPADITRLGELMDALGYSPDVELWLMAETPRGVFNTRELCQAHERVGALLMGTHCVLAAREANIDVLDGVCLDLANPEIYQVQCEQGRRLGFDGKTLIHPSQIAIANAVFAPSDDDVERAQHIMTAWNEALARGDGLCVLNGKLVENLHADEALRTLALHEAIQARLL
ncbi:MAG: CoA ester lyase [Gammaproteobacteria bacterium]|nr:CoA ester lyase [Gammaproteobacteria bacterium]